jgi:hypothetical protein
MAGYAVRLNQDSQYSLCQFGAHRLMLGPAGLVPGMAAAEGRGPDGSVRAVQLHACRRSGESNCIQSLH